MVADTLMEIYCYGQFHPESDRFGRGSGTEKLAGGPQEQAELSGNGDQRIRPWYTEGITLTGGPEIALMGKGNGGIDLQVLEKSRIPLCSASAGR